MTPKETRLVSVQVALRTNDDGHKCIAWLVKPDNHAKRLYCEINNLPETCVDDGRVLTKETVVGNQVGYTKLPYRTCRHRHSAVGTSAQTERSRGDVAGPQPERTMRHHHIGTMKMQHQAMNANRRTTLLQIDMKRGPRLSRTLSVET